MRTRKMLISILIALAGLYLLLCAGLYLFQDRLIFLPSRELDLQPDAAGLEFEDVRIPVAPGESVHAWYFPQADTTTVTRSVLICHGNAGNISHRLGTVQLFLQLGCRVLLFDYRGYGRSDGRPSEQNTYADARAAWDWLLTAKRARPEDIFLFGRSLGGAVAVALAGQVSCGGLILESTFSSVADMGSRLYPFLPIRLLTRTHFDSREKIGRLSCPVLVAHSPTDEVIPYELGRALFDAAGPNKRFIELVGGHNELKSLGNELYHKALRDLFDTGPGDSTL